MGHLHRRLLGGVLAVAMIGASACDNTLAPSLDWKLTVGITAGSNRPHVGDTTQMGAFVTDASRAILSDSVNVTTQATWSVMGPAGVVSVSQTGLVTALAPGAVAIVATFSGRTADQSLVVE